jgi:hypothetical protein
MSTDKASSIVETPPAYRDVTWEKAAGQREIFVPLHHFPPQLKFGDDFPEPIRYDSAKERLCYRGLMYHGSYSFLRSQSTDANYLIAIDQLYQLSSNPPKKRHIAAWVSAISAGIAAALASAWRLTH